MRRVLTYFKRSGFRPAIRLFLDYLVFSKAFLYVSFKNRPKRFFLNILTVSFFNDSKLEWPEVFSSAGYVRDNPNNVEVRKHPVLHYLNSSKGWNPRTVFDREYLARRPDLVTFQRSLLIHYLRYKETTLGNLEEKFYSDTVFNPNELIIRIPEFKRWNLPKNLIIDVETCSRPRYNYDYSIYSSTNFQIVVNEIKHSHCTTKDLTNQCDVIEERTDCLRVSLKIHDNTIFDLSSLLHLISVYNWGERVVSKEDQSASIESLKHNIEYLHFLISQRDPALGNQTASKNDLIRIFNQMIDGSQLTYKTEQSPKVIAKLPQRVLLVSHEDKNSGAPRYAAEVATKLVAEGYQVKVVIYSSDDPDGIFLDAKLDFEYIRSRISRLGLPGREHTHWLRSPSAKRAFEDIISDFGPSLILFNSLATSDLVQDAVRLQIPHIMYVHENWGKDNSIINSPDPFLKAVNYALVNSHTVLFGSNSSLETWTEQVEIHKSIVLPSITNFNSILLDNELAIAKALRNELHLEDQHVVFLSVAVFEPRKRIEDIIRAYKSLGIPNSKLILVGKSGRFPDYEMQMEEMADSDNSISIHPSTKSLKVFYSIADYFLHASKQEVFPLVLQEAMTFNLPIVCSKYPGYEEMFGKGYKYLFDVGNIDDFVLKIQEIVEYTQSAKIALDKVKFDLSARNRDGLSQLISEINQVSKIVIFADGK